jgi:GTP-binding protein
MFVDEVTVYLKAGDGGKGCLSFRREKFIPKGGPNGGDGGDGGNVELSCSRHENDFSEYRYKPHARAENGSPGSNADRHGRNGRHCILKVPPGTVVLDEPTRRIVAELLVDGESIILLKGGKGGLGNTTFKSPVQRAPTRTTPGRPGQEGQFIFVLKTIADVGLVGFPNAGKSSLLRAWTQATPKVAPYPFTTLHPSVGVMEGNDPPVFVADIPGIIAGASHNRGLGFRFLRHIERCHALLFVLDASALDRHPEEALRVLFEELRCYDRELLGKPRVVVVNKMDLEGADENLARLSKSFVDETILPVSCLSKRGLEELKGKVCTVVARRKQILDVV